MGNESAEVQTSLESLQEVLDRASVKDAKAITRAIDRLIEARIADSNRED